MTNNVAEYHAALQCLRAYFASDRPGPLEIRGDSKLVVEQMEGRWRMKGGAYLETAAMAKDTLSMLKLNRVRVSWLWIPRAQNSEADDLSKAGLRGAGVTIAARGGEESELKALRERVAQLERERDHLAQAATEREQEAEKAKQHLLTMRDRMNRYSDAIGKVLSGVRSRRDTGEPALSDAEEIQRLIDGINLDRTGMARALDEVRRRAGGAAWLGDPEAWGAYDWEERTIETIRKEAGEFAGWVETFATDALRKSGDVAVALLRNGDTLKLDEPPEVVELRRELAAAKGQILKLELCQEMACIETDPKCDCAGCLRARELNGAS